MTAKMITMEVSAIPRYSFPAELSLYPMLEESFENPTLRNHSGVLPFRLKVSEWYASSTPEKRTRKRPLTVIPWDVEFSCTFDVDWKEASRVKSAVLSSNWMLVWGYWNSHKASSSGSRIMVTRAPSVCLVESHNSKPLRIPKYDGPPGSRWG